MLFFWIGACASSNSPEDRRVERIQNLLRTSCLSSNNSRISFNANLNGGYNLSVIGKSGDANLELDAEIINATEEGALNYADEKLRALQDSEIRTCIKDILPTILDDLRTPEQKSAACYREKIDHLLVSLDFETHTVSARAESPGLSGGKKTASAELCYNGLQGYDNINTNFKLTSCLGGRCSVSPIQNNVNQTTNTASSCVKMEAWSQSSSFGAGGKVSGYLFGSVARTLTDEIKNEVSLECNRRFLVNENPV